MDVAWDKDSCWPVAFGSCPAVQTDHSLYTKLFVLQSPDGDVHVHQELGLDPSSKAASSFPFC